MNDPVAQGKRQAVAARLVDWRRRTSTRLIAGLGAGLASLWSLGYASYKLNQPPAVDQVQPGAAVDAGRWLIKVNSAAFNKGDSAAVYDRDRKDTVRLDMQLTNLSGMSDSTYISRVAIDGLGKGALPPTYMLRRDGSYAAALHPDMPEEVTAIWEWPADKPAPKSLNLEFVGEFFKAQDNLYAQPGWFPKGTVARMELPVAPAQIPTQGKS